MCIAEEGRSLELYANIWIQMVLVLPIRDLIHIVSIIGDVDFINVHSYPVLCMCIRPFLSTAGY